MWKTMSLLGVDMARRRNRRWLVACIYLILFALWGAGWREGDMGKIASTVLLYAVVFTAFVIFGGYGRFGLIKPFCTKRPFGRPTSWHNDERDLNRRDRMHFYSYRVVMCMVLLSLIFTIEPLTHPMILRNVVMLIILVGMTLPPALMLWLEPDIERDNDSVSASGEAEGAESARL